MFSNAALGLQARLRAQRRDARAVVLRWSRVVVTEEEVALVVVEGRSSRKEHGQRRVGVCEERVETEEKREEEQRERTRQSGGRWMEEWCVWRADERERGQGANTKEKLSAMEGKYGWRAQRHRGERGGRTTRASITKEGANRVWRGKDGACTNEKTGISVDKKEE
ncbi:hypothetical protein FB451DRAFT_1182410 [Mycena latifolia]|nr:hypothetical protein FB451DRAFT_1182410 [Mycena latifolia]